MARHQRAIDIDSPEQPVTLPGEWNKTVRDGDTVEQRWRIGDRLFIHSTTVTVDETTGDSRRSVDEIERSAIIRFEKIVAKCKVEPDDHAEAPWESCDGWEHHLRDRGTWDDHIDATRKVATHRKQWTDDDVHAEDRKRNEDFQAAAAYFRDDRGRGQWVMLDYDVGDNRGRRRDRRGASKQVAAERAAAMKRRTLKQLVDWYRNGWGYWVVSCTYRGQEASCSGIDDEDYARKDGVLEIAAEVAAGLEDEGYIIIGYPHTPRFKNGYTLKGFKLKIAHQMGEQNVSRR